MYSKEKEKPEDKHPKVTPKPGAIDPPPKKSPSGEKPDIYDPPLIPEKS